jgi:hypothetical protein
MKMKKNFMTTQDVIDICARLYDNGYSRVGIRTLLFRWRDSGVWKATDTDAERVFDLIVG